MISLPIDEMLLDLRAKLEMFEREGSYAALDEVYRETRRIDCTCEDAIEQAQGEPVAWMKKNQYGEDVVIPETNMRDKQPEWVQADWYKNAVPLYTSAPSIPEGSTSKAYKEGYESGLKDAIPEGWQLVPVEPTPKMLIEAGPMTNYDFDAPVASPDNDHVEWYRAMLSAAPKPDTPQTCFSAGDMADAQAKAFREGIVRSVMPATIGLNDENDGRTV